MFCRETLTFRTVSGSVANFLDLGAKPSHFDENI